MEAKSDERFYTPRSSARRGYSSAGSEDERFVSPRTSARSVSSDDNEYTTPREHASSPTQSEDYLKRAAGKVPRLGVSELKQALPEYDEKPVKYAEAAPSRGYSARPSSAASEIRNVQYVEAPAVPENDVFSAARHNRIDSVTYMLDQGISVNSKDAHGNTILSIACQNGLKRMAKLALRRGANINSQNNRGNTALHFCFAYGYGDSLGEYLISKGADTRIGNDDGLVCYEGIDLRSPRK
ncbi:hypothetical protein Poli38472_002480 [Pythium oligandrum]|uniref:Uncharacterized protein n=1 Tax=Pythium oligandrum TaxID=41045 RepID=A0A8K1FJV6_PYTOL|nr:hypothetical protein Poli38472_002480 [Pythium oligandrum]|eukprot:TMW63539.1 hypothetical protein Poli38472_002480 [Pythium oligandrum]